MSILEVEGQTKNEHVDFRDVIYIDNSQQQGDDDAMKTIEVDESNIIEVEIDVGYGSCE